MRKIFTLAAALLASFSLWAAEPNFESYDWQSKEAAEAVAGNHDGIVISYAGLGDPGNVSGHWYIPMNQNLKNGDSSWKYFGVAATQKIDSVSILYCPNGENKTSIAWVAWGKDVTPNQYTLAHGETAGTTSSKSWDNAIWETIDLSAVEDAYTVYIARSVREFREIGATKNLSNFGAGQTVNILGIRVWVHDDRKVDHVDVSLGGVAVNGEALSDIQMATLYGALTLNLAAEYVEAPTVTFTVQTDTYYVGEVTPSTKSEKIDVVAALNPDGKWQAQQTVGEQTYTITAVKPATATVTYMDGATVLGEEIVKVGESATKHGEYEVKPLAEFQGWYTDAELTSKADLSATVGADMVLYGKFVKAYAQSLNIEQLVVTNGKSYGIKDALTAAGYEYSDLDALDSLNNSKGAARNEPYLGLKIKKQGGFIACNVATGSTIRVKFGYVENDVLAIAGNDTMTLTPDNKTLNVLEYTATADTYVKIQTTSGKTVVIKQIMVNEAITDVMYKITYEAAENGKVEGWTIAFPHEKVNLTVTPDSAYHVVSVTAGNEVLLPDTANNYSFEMPGQATTVSATFAADEPVVPTLYTVTLGTYENGNVAFIEPNEDNKYAEGAEVRLSVTPDEGFEVEAISLEGIDLAIPVVDGVATFSMPAQDVVVLASFKAAAPQPTLYTVTLGTYEHGTVAFIEPNEGNKYAKDAEVRLSVTPDEGYELADISLEGINLIIPVVDGVASFNMPAQDVTVLATFKAKEEGFENIDASTKAVKFIEDGQLYIIKNGVKYNTQGAVVNQ